jgi:hypothetical protein
MGTVYEATDRALARGVAVLAGSYAPLSAHMEDPSSPWQEFFARSLATERARRPPSAADFFRYMEQALT